MHYKSQKFFWLGAETPLVGRGIPTILWKDHVSASWAIQVPWWTGVICQVHITLWHTPQPKHTNYSQKMIKHRHAVGKGLLHNLKDSQRPGCILVSFPVLLFHRHWIKNKNILINCFFILKFLQNLPPKNVFFKRLFLISGLQFLIKILHALLMLPSLKMKVKISYSTFLTAMILTLYIHTLI